MSNLEANFQADVDAISSIPIIPTLLSIICHTTGMGFAAVARVTENRWIACSVYDKIMFGLEPGGELEVETTICHEIRQSGRAVVIDHVANDEAFCGHPTPAMYGFQSYISMPILRQDGSFFGTLCAIDPKPAKLNTPEVIGMFKLYAELISFHLNSFEQLQSAEKKLQEEQKNAELREQFIAILGHDLRNPVSATLNSAQLLVRIAPDERTVRIANIIQDSSYRMKGLIDNIMDFAQGRLGGGLTLKRVAEVPVEKVLNHVITELLAIWPGKIIETQYEITEPVNCDSNRVAQLFSNLLSNAISHGKKGAAILVEAISVNGEFSLTVANKGDKIGEETMKRLFKPFSRGMVKTGQEGLGLGLFISSEIAAAHSGTIEATSTDEETRFTFRMPLVD